MLKIKNNVDLKELEKFGFTKKFDVDTGKLKYYQYKNRDKIIVYVGNRQLTYDSYYDEIAQYHYTPDFIENVLYDLIELGILKKTNE